MCRPVVALRGAVLLVLSGSGVARAEPPAQAPAGERPTASQSTTGEGSLPADYREGNDDPIYGVPIVHSLGLMTTLRLSEAWIWPDPFAETDLSVIGQRYEAAFTEAPKWDSSARPFEWDGDRWWINAIGHPLLGSEFYLRSRTCHLTPAVALLMTAGASAVWEYGYEANGVRPSGLDLWFTPLSGALVGEGRFWLWRGARDIADPSWRRVLMTLVDPLGEFERALGTRC